MAWTRGETDTGERVRERIAEVEVEREMERETREEEKEKEDRRAVEQARKTPVQTPMEESNDTLGYREELVVRVVLPQPARGKVVCLKVVDEIGLCVLRDTG
jgi:hypothetical protein